MSRRRIIITGVERSGTSCVARVLDCLGVPIQSPGEAHAHVTLNPTGYYEEPKMNHWIEEGNWEQVSYYIQQRRHIPMWGLKDPRLSVVSKMKPFLECFPDDEQIEVVLVFRAAEAIHQSWGRCGQNRPLSEVRERKDQLAEVSRLNTPMVNIEYETLVKIAEESVCQLNDRLALYASTTQKIRAAHAVDRKLKHF